MNLTIGYKWDKCVGSEFSNRWKKDRDKCVRMSLVWKFLLYLFFFTFYDVAQFCVHGLRKLQKKVNPRMIGNLIENATWISSTFRTDEEISRSVVLHPPSLCCLHHFLYLACRPKLFLHDYLKDFSFRPRSIFEVAMVLTTSHVIPSVLRARRKSPITFTFKDFQERVQVRTLQHF